jgi:DNA-binding SARP family transcriptional activator/LysM repeat protein
VTVRQGDTLSAIAERTLGNADDWPRLYAANRAAVGSDPDVIDPGLVLTVPSAAVPGGGGNGSGGTGSGATGTPTPAPPTTPPSPSPTPSPAPTPTEKPTPAPTSAPAPSESAPSTPAPSASTPAAPAVGHPDLARAAETAAGGTALLAAALVAALGLRRRRQQERRRAHRRIPMPPPPTALFEAQLRARQDALGLDLLDRSLRSLARTAAQEQKRLPAVVAVRVTRARTVELHLAAPAAPLAPFRAAHASTVWWCTPESPGLLDPAAAADVPAPYPALVGLGTAADGSTVLVDLEAVRLVQLTGEGPEITAVLRTLAVELALSPLADHLRLHYVGEAPELAEALGGDRLRVHATLEEAVAAVESRDRAVRERLLADGAAHVRDARARGGTDDAWSPDIVLCGDAPAGEMPIVLGRLLDARPRTCLAVVTGAPAPGTAPRARWTLPTTGTCTLPGSNVEVELQRLDDGEYAHWIELLSLAASTDEAPAPEWTAQAADDEDEYDDEEYAHYGAGTPDDEDDEDYPEAEIAEAAVEAEPAAPPAAPYPTRPYPAPDAAPPAPVRNGRGAHRGRSEAPYGLGVTPARPEAASPFPPERGAEPPAAVDARVRKQEEEAVLAVLRAQPLPSHPETAEPARPSIRVLGPVELLGARGPVDLDRRSRLTEIAAFLALNPGSDQRSLDLLLHASGESDLRSLSAAVGRLRDWLGDGSDGDPYLPLDSSQGYTFSGEVACDWDDFRGLHRRGLRGGPGSDLALARALSLVRGAPFAETDPTGYAWAEPFRQDMVSAIVDTAHELAVRRLARADYRSAEAAVYRGLLVEPGAELLHRDLLTVYAAAGARDQLLKAVSRLNNLATRSGRGLERETADLLRELLDA